MLSQISRIWWRRIGGARIDGGGKNCKKVRSSKRYQPRPDQPLAATNTDTGMAQPGQREAAGQRENLIVFVLCRTGKKEQGLKGRVASEATAGNWGKYSGTCVCMCVCVCVGSMYGNIGLPHM